VPNICSDACLTHWVFAANYFHYTRAVRKVRGLTLLLRVGTLWRCGDGLFFETPPFASDALLTTLHSLPENVLRIVDHFEISCLGAHFSWLEKPRNGMGTRSELYGGCSNGVSPIHFFQAEHRIQFRSRCMWCLGFSNYEKGSPRKEISKWSTVCSTFSRSGWSVVRSASLAKGGTTKKRPSSHLDKVPTPSNKVSPRTFQTDLVTLFNITTANSTKELVTSHHTKRQSFLLYFALWL
jgi:hypothetical protein